MARIAARKLKQLLYQSQTQLQDAGVWAYSQTRPQAAVAPTKPCSIFVLRNNDLGDLLAITPLFAALRQRFPNAEIVAGVGAWSLPILAGNPHLSGTIAVNAPWFNKFVPAQGWRDRWRYLQHSEAVAAIAARQFDIGIDVLGSSWGALLLLRAGIPYRLGVRGFAGGAVAMQQCIPFDPQQRVCRSVLGFAELLGVTELPACRPQLFLTADEQRAGEQCWTGQGRRVAIAPGSGNDPRYWSQANYRQLIRQLTRWEPPLDIVMIGGPQDAEFGLQLAALGETARNLTGQLPLRQTFALLATADLLITNSSMALHAAAAFKTPTLALLGPSYPSQRQHDAQWGYDEAYFCLGRNVGQRDRIYSADEVIAQLQARGWL